MLTQNGVTAEQIESTSRTLEKIANSETVQYFNSPQAVKDAFEDLTALVLCEAEVPAWLWAKFAENVLPKLATIARIVKCGKEAKASEEVATAFLAKLRQQYVDEVSALANKAAQMREAGYTSEEIARSLHAERRAIEVKYKEMTPLDQLEVIYAGNLKKYGDKLGPTIEYLRAKGRTWDDIIESACRAGGKDLGL